VLNFISLNFFIFLVLKKISQRDRERERGGDNDQISYEKDEEKHWKRENL
jgi:large-conductance mechanosensitive channel